MAGDRNNPRVEAITSLDPTLKQLVNGFTNKKGDKVLDVILTDSHDLLQEPPLLPQEGERFGPQGCRVPAKDQLSNCWWGYEEENFGEEISPIKN